MTMPLGGSFGMEGSMGTYGASMGDSMVRTGIDRRYESITNIKEPSFKRNTVKNEANIQPDKGSTIKITGKKVKVTEPNPYETQINSRMAPADVNDVAEGQMATGFPKVTFAAQ